MGTPKLLQGALNPIMEPSSKAESLYGPSITPAKGFLIVNADDWGRDELTTNRILDCTALGTVSSVSAMVFMKDSERSAAIAQERRIETGLHINFTTEFSASDCRAELIEHQQKVGRYLLRHRLAQAVFHPGLKRSFEYLVAAQIDEYRRIYGASPSKIDGHHHMHLCANVTRQELLPEGTLVRRNFSFNKNEKGLVNRFYRNRLDRKLAKRHKLTGYFYSLPPLEPQSRLQQIYSLAVDSVVEVETHPVVPEEYGYLTGKEIFGQIKNTRIAPPSLLFQ